MIEKVVAKRRIDESTILEDLEYWFNRSPEERISAVEILRRQHYGSSERLRKFVELLNEHKVDFIIVGGFA